mgnify:FL=1
MVCCEEVADAPAFVMGQAIDARDGAVHAREDEPLRLGGSVRAGIGKLGGHREVVMLAPKDFGGADAVLAITVDAPITAFLLRNNTWLDHGVAVIEDDVLRLSGAVDALSAALADITLIPSPDWHGHARLHLNLTEHGVELASTAIELDVEGVQDAPEIIDAGGPYAVDEDTYLPLSIKLMDPDYDHEEDPQITCSLRATARSGSLRIVGGKATAASSGSILLREDGLLLQRTPSSITSTLKMMEYISAPDWHGDDTIDIVADDGGGFPRGDSLVATLSIPIRVHAIDDAPRITSPAKVLFQHFERLAGCLTL